MAYVYTLRRARVKHACKMGDGLISPGEYCYAITIAGGGLQSLKFPDYLHQHCLNAFMLLEAIKNKKEALLELKRAPGTCCPEPTCDIDRERTWCDSCGADCLACTVEETKEEDHGVPTG
jgi:hypothetical protein